MLSFDYILIINYELIKKISLLIEKFQKHFAKFHSIQIWVEHLIPDYATQNRCLDKSKKCRKQLDTSQEQNFQDK